MGVGHFSQDYQTLIAGRVASEAELQKARETVAEKIAIEAGLRNLNKAVTLA